MLGIVICHNHNEDQSEAECEPQAARWLVFVLVPDSQPLKHWHLWVTNKSLLYTDAATGVWGPGWLQDGTGPQKDQGVIRGVEPSAPPWPPGEERGRRLDQLPMASDLISRACVMEPPQKPLKALKRLRSGSFGLVKRGGPGGWAPWGHGSSTPPPPSGGSWVVSFIINQ